MRLFTSKPTPPESPAAERVAISTAGLIALRHGAAGLSLRASRVRAAFGQTYLSNFKGRGMEFDESRPYLPGDDVRNIDWRVTARTGQAHTKLFREERERPVIVAVDYRPAMFFATQGCFKSVQAARLAALLAWTASRQGDRLGGLIFTDTEHWEFKPKLRSAATLHFLEQLSARGQERSVSVPETQTDVLRNALVRLRRVAHPGSLVAVISDFRELDAAGEAQLAVLARHCEVVLVFVYDPLETQLPPAGQYRLADHARELTVDTADAEARRLFAERFAARRQAVERLCERQGMRFVSCASTDEPLPCLQRGLGVLTR